LLFSAVISEHFSKNRICSGCKNMVSQKCVVLLGHPVHRWTRQTASLACNETILFSQWNIVNGDVYKNVVDG